MRNFWLDCNIDGRKNNVTGGPRRKEDGLNLTIFQRENGCSITSITVQCYVDTDGKLHTRVFDREKLVTDVVTDR